MSFNGFDIILLFILLVAFVLGIIKGFVRQVVALLAVIVGLILAVAYYAQAARLFVRLTSRQTLADLLGFFSIFLVVLMMGWLLSRLFSKMMKGPLKFFNHVLGGLLGLLEGVLICGVVVFALLVFPVSIHAVEESSLTPYCLRMTETVIGLVPRELKDRFRETYDQIMEKEVPSIEMEEKTGKRRKNAERV